MDVPARQVWVPGAASCLLFAGWCVVLGLTPFGGNRFPFITVPYLAAMPFAGALGAYLSRRMQGAVVERIVAALFPVLTLVMLFAVRIVFGLWFEGRPYTLPHFLDGLGVTLKFAMLAGPLLILGAWPFCRSHSGSAA